MRRESAYVRCVKPVACIAAAAAFFSSFAADTWEKVTYLAAADSVTLAFDGRIALKWGHIGLGSGITDTLRTYETALPPAFAALPAGMAFYFVNALQSPPILVGIRIDSIPAGFDKENVRVYRIAGGQLLVMHTSYVDSGYAWVYTNDMTQPFLALVDASRPLVTITSDTATALVEGAALAVQFGVSDNVANAYWRLLYGRGHMSFEGEMADTLSSNAENIVKVIPGNMVSGSYGLRATLVVSDGAYADTVDISYRVRTSRVDEFVTRVNQWVPLRATAEPDNKNVQSCLADLAASGEPWLYDPAEFRLFCWYPYAGNAASADKWVEYADSIAGVFDFVAGKVIWIKTRAARAIRFGAGVSTSLKEPYAITLPPANWTDFALPCKFSVRLADVFAATGPAADTLQFIHWDKIDIGYVAEDIYAMGIPSLSATDDTLFFGPPYDAYSVYNPLCREVVLKIPPNPISMPAMLSKSIGRTAQADTTPPVLLSIDDLPRHPEPSPVDVPQCSQNAARPQMEEIGVWNELRIVRADGCTGYYLRLPAAGFTAAKISLFDPRGRLVWQSRMRSADGNLHSDLRLPATANGLYVISVSVERAGGNREQPAYVFPLVIQ